MHIFCTLTSQYHLTFTLTLISKISHPVYILALDEYSYDFFKKIKKKNTRIFHSKNLKNKRLNDLKLNRNKIEYIFTLKPIFINFLLTNILRINNYLIYLDSDIFLLQNSKYFVKNIKKYSIFLTKHNFSKPNQDKNIYGIFNAGFISIKCDNFGKKYSKLWSNQCIKSCKLDLNNDNKIFADQGYLNFFDKKKSNKVKILDGSIHNLAPWNIDNFKINFEKSILYSNNNKVIFYHFQFYRIFLKYFILPSLHTYKVTNTKHINRLYKIYSLEIKKNFIKYKLPYPPIDMSLIKKFIKSMFKLDLKFIIK